LQNIKLFPLFIYQFSERRKISNFTKNFIYMGGTANVEMSKFMKWFVSLLQSIPSWQAQQEKQFWV
jgi:hypothetical protein